MPTGEWVYLGTVGKAHGLRGRFVVRLVLAGEIRPIPVGSRILLDDREHLVVRSTVRDAERLILECEGLWTREQADELNGVDVYILRSSIDFNDGIFPLYAIIGLQVCSGDFTGPVVGVDPIYPNPQLLVRGMNGVFQVPLNMVLAGGPDWEAGTVEVDLPEGLEEMVIEP